MDRGAWQGYSPWDCKSRIRLNSNNNVTGSMNWVNIVGIVEGVMVQEALSL